MQVYGDTFISVAAWYDNELGFANRLANFLSWFVFFGMFLGEPTHLLVFPNLEGGRYHYFPGMWTALLPMVMGVWGIYVTLQEHKKITGVALLDRNRKV